MKYTDKQINYFKKRADGNKFLLKKTVMNFLEENNIFHNNASKKNELLNIIYSDEKLFEKFIDKYGSSLEVPYYTVASNYSLTYFQVSELDQLGIIKQLPYTGDKEETLYPFSVLGYEDNYLLDEYEKKFTTGFHRTRIEFKDDEEYVQEFLNKLSAVFELENISRLYPHKNNDGYYLYLSMKIRTDSLNNNDILAKLKADLSLKQEKIDKLEHKLAESLNKQIQVGRPSKLSAQDIETIKCYRLQNKSYRELAVMFNCSVGLISKVLKDFEMK